MKIGYTTGAYDLFHIGHLNIFKNAKKFCDYLIVGVSTDELIKKYKNKATVIPFDERKAIVESIKYVDKVVAQTSLDKVSPAVKNKANIVFVGSDWQNSPSWIEYEEELAKHGIKVIYLPHTARLTTTRLIDQIQAMPLRAKPTSS
jgi:glycerol-3-phosphate cytidylyltransferase